MLQQHATMLKSVVATLLPLSLGVFGSANSSDIDPINNFCKRLSHQSVIKNGTLYIDGGFEVFVGENNNGSPKGDQVLGYNEYLITVDMTSSWNWKTNISMIAKNKTENPNTGTLPPTLVRGALYAGSEDDPNVYLYGGTTSYVNTSFPGFQWPDSSQYALWSYGTLDKSWGQYDLSVSAPYRPAGGAYADATDQGLAFYMNGFIDNGTSSGLEHEYNLMRYLDGLIVIDTTTQQVKNLSTSSLENTPRAKSGLVYLPNVGTKGILVSMGGVTKPTSDSSGSNEGTYVSFSKIDFLDIASTKNGKSDGTWYSQTATGEIPDPRTDFCIVAASAPDNSSHNIYLYGGRGANDLYDQIYVLSIPSFTWMKVAEGKSPRYGHTCHVVGQKQMVTVGGDASWDLVTGCDWELKGLAIMDMSTFEWGSVYNAYAGNYQVPSQIYSVIGGSSTGGANSTPSAGFSTNQIATFFNQPGSSSSNKTTSSATSARQKSGHISGGAIAGAVIGSVVGAALIIILAIFLFRRRKNQHTTKEQDMSPVLVEAPSDGKPARFGGALFRNRGRAAELATTRNSSIVPSSATYVHSDSETGVLPVSPARNHQAQSHQLASTPLHEMEGGQLPSELPGEFHPFAKR